MNWVHRNLINIQTNNPQSILALILLLFSLCLWQYLLHFFFVDELDLRALSLSTISILLPVLQKSPFNYCVGCATLDCSSLFWMWDSFLLNLIVRSLSTEMIPYVLLFFFFFPTSLHISQQKVFIILWHLLSFVLYSHPVCLHIYRTFSLPSIFSRKALTALPSSEHTWFLVWRAHVSPAPHDCVSWIFTVMPYFSYYSYPILRFLRGAIIYYPILCFSVPNKISALIIQGLKPNICFLRLLKVGKTG